MGEAPLARKKTISAATSCDPGIESRRKGISGRDGAGVQMFVDDFSRGVLAGATAAAHGQATLHFEQRPRAFIHGFADLAIGDGMTNANVHRTLLPLSRGWRIPPTSDAEYWVKYE